MSLLQNPKSLISALLIAVACSFSSQLLAKAVEQTVHLSVITPVDGSQCRVGAAFEGYRDNCGDDQANGRSECTEDTGCVCTRQEEHVSWKIEGNLPFDILFDQGSKNPFEGECELESGKAGEVRCRVKSKNVQRGEYTYSVHVLSCIPAISKIRIY